MKKLLFGIVLVTGCASQTKPEITVENREQNFIIVKVNMEEYLAAGALKAATDTAKPFCNTGDPILETQYDKQTLDGARRTVAAPRVRLVVGTGANNRYFRFKCPLQAP